MWKGFANPLFRSNFSWARPLGLLTASLPPLEGSRLLLAPLSASTPSPHISGLVLVRCFSYFCLMSQSQSATRRDRPGKTVFASAGRLQAASSAQSDLEVEQCVQGFKGKPEEKQQQQHSD